MSYDGILPAGKAIQGKWNGNRYVVERLLGEGANGRVYLVSTGRLRHALKLGFDAVDLQTEVNVLKSLSAGIGKEYRHFLLDVDDIEEEAGAVPFYVMKYIQGCRIDEYMRRRGSDWIYMAGMRLLDKLEGLHRLGWIFGDLKNENIMVSGYGEVELVDYGGVTQVGRSVRQFTEVYDRGNWNGGSRKADPGYDLFSFGILLLLLAPNRQVQETLLQTIPQNRSLDTLRELAADSGYPQAVRAFLRKLFSGRYASAAAAKADWRTVALQAGAAPRVRVEMPWLKGLFIASLAVFAAASLLILLT